MVGAQTLYLPRSHLDKFFTIGCYPCLKSNNQRRPTMFKNKTFIPWLIAAVAVNAVIVILLGGAKPSISGTANTATVTTVTRAESIDASGYLQAESYAGLVWKTGGTVASVSASVGDPVMAGDILMSLQTTSASANAISAQADLLNAQNQFEALTNPDGKACADA
jgi:multidrug efflux pump subunit AcrA (membrane-fusion protein)